jgi:outer membrane protein assembly factor BamB
VRARKAAELERARAEVARADAEAALAQAKAAEGAAKAAAAKPDPDAKTTEPKPSAAAKNEPAAEPTTGAESGTPEPAKPATKPAEPTVAKAAEKPVEAAAKPKATPDVAAAPAPPPDRKAGPARPDIWPGPRVAGSWAHWRGPEQNGISREKNLPDTWNLETGENLLWQAPYGARSTPLILDGRVYVINNAGENADGSRSITEQERVMCLDAATGKVLWEYKFNLFHTDIPSNRVGWANLAGDPETGFVYAHGVQGTLLCLDKEGQVVWDHSLTETFGRISGYGGRVHTPIVDEDLVILSFLNSSFGPQAPGSHRYVAFDKRTGEVVWWSTPGDRPLDTTYSTPVVSVINGQRLLIAGNADGAVYALKVRTGEKVWGCVLSKRGINVSPVVEGNRVYIGHSEENVYPTDPAVPLMGSIVCIDATGKGDVTKTHIQWKHDGIDFGYASPLLVDGKLYCVDNAANMHCLAATDGKTLWTHKLGTVGKGSPVWADGKLYVNEVNGRLLILQPSDGDCQELDVKQLGSKVPGTKLEVHASPAIADGRVYFVTREAIYCVGKKDTKPQSASLPPVPVEPAPSADAAPAFVQVVPAEVHVKPGDKVQFQVRLFDANGRRVKDQPATWSLKGVKGKVEAGQLALAPDGGSHAGAVVAEVAGLSGTARVRAVPAPPFAEDFEKVDDGKVPSAWIGAAGKCQVVALDGNKVLKKLGDDARFQRADIFFGPALMTGYTIEAEVRGTEKKRALPDMGVTANRYTLELQGTKQRLAIISWRPMPRLQQVTPFKWTKDTWYHAKLRVDIQGDKALVRGKVWPRGQDEPDQWTIEVEDPMPNREGSPGLYGYAANIAATPGSEVFFDNVKVTPNGK